MTTMFGQIQLEDFEEERLPQKAQSAWDGANMNGADGRTGATFKALKYCGHQQVNGTNYYYIAERTIPYSTPIRNIVRLAIYEHDGEYEFLEKSVLVVL